MTTKETRLESFLRTDRGTRQQMILSAWEGPMTAREIARKLGFSDLNAVKPRITELAQSGELIEAGKKWDQLTDRTVTCWRLAKAIPAQSKPAAKGPTMRDAAALLQENGFPGMNHGLLSHALHSERTGVTLTPEAATTLLRLYKGFSALTMHGAE